MQLTKLTAIIEIKTLLNYQSILKGEQNQLADWRKTLSAYNDNLRQMAEQIAGFSRYTLLSPQGNDTTAKKLYNSQLADLRLKLQKAACVYYLYFQLAAKKYRLFVA